MSNQNIREIQKKELEMLIYFQNICKNHNLKFYLCGGGLIGAIRNKGFIPWDDDIDVFMPRPDYEKLPVIWKKFADTRHYSYCRTTEDELYHDAGSSIRDNYTTFINQHSVNEDICQGLALEIMPLDGCPKGRIARGKQILNAMIFALFNAQRLPDNKGKIIRILAGLIYKIFPSKKIRYHIWKKAEKEMSQYKWEECDEVTELVGSLKGMRIRHPKEDFEKVIYKEFEGYQVPVMAGYERYLKLIWGNYMSLPPIEKRVAKHDTVFIDMHHSYKDYRGKYYYTDIT